MFISDFQALDWKFATRAALAATSALMIGSYFSNLFNRPDYLVSGLWCAITSVIVLQGLLGSTYKAAWNRFLGVIFGSFLGGVFSILFGSDPFSLGLGVFFTVIACSIFRLEESYRIAAASTVIVVALGGNHPEISPLAFSFFRFMDSTLGIIVGMAASLLVFPARGSKRIRAGIIDILKIQKTRLTVLLNARVTGQFPEPSSEFSSKIVPILYRLQLVQEESKFEWALGSESRDFYKALLNEVEDLYNEMISFDYVNHPSVWEIFDKDIHKQIDTIDLTTRESFNLVISSLENDEKLEESSRLKATMEGLNQELLHFREKKITRQYNLDDVEGFFVYFYSLKSILHAMQKIEQLLRS